MISEEERVRSEVEPWLAEHIPHGDGIAIDVGANIGEWTSFLANRFFKVASIEPDPRAILLRQENCAGLQNVWLVNKAVCGSPGKITLYQYEKSVWTSSCECRDDAGAHTGSFDVECTTLDELYSAIRVLQPDKSVQFIKIDIEGGETLALHGGRQLLAEQLPKLIVEIHSPLNAASCASILHDLGYSLKKVIHPWRVEGEPGTEQHFWYIAERAK